MPDPSRPQDRGGEGINPRSMILTLTSLLPLLGGIAQARSLSDAYTPQVVTASTHDAQQDTPRRHAGGRSPPEIPNLRHGVTTAKYRSTEDDATDDPHYALHPALRIENAVARPPFAVAPALESAGDLVAYARDRSLHQYEAAQPVLISTIDGRLQARDRKTGTAMWAIDFDGSPMIQTSYPCHNSTEGVQDECEQEYIYIVEPTRDGALYAQHRNGVAGIQYLDATVKSLAGKSPFVFGDHVTTATQTTSTVVVDAMTGEIVQQFGSPGTGSDTRQCRRVTGLESNERGFGRKEINVGRVEYTLRFEHKSTRQEICTIKYAEWVPNRADEDLQAQFTEPLDSIAIQTMHTGRVMALDRVDRNRRHWQQNLDSAVAQVFDVVAPTEEGGDSELVVLARPLDSPVHGLPAEVWKGGRDRIDRVYVNQTITGGWYALSEKAYPGVTQGALQAPTQIRSAAVIYPLDFYNRPKELIGVHSLVTSANIHPSTRLTIDPSAPARDIIIEPSKGLDLPPNVSEEQVKAAYAPKLPWLALTALCVITAGGYLAIRGGPNALHHGWSVYNRATASSFTRQPVLVSSQPAAAVTAPAPIEQIVTSEATRNDNDAVADVDEETPTIADETSANEISTPVDDASPQQATERSLEDDLAAGEEKQTALVQPEEPEPKPDAGDVNPNGNAGEEQSTAASETLATADGDTKVRRPKQRGGKRVQARKAKQALAQSQELDGSKETTEDSKTEAAREIDVELEASIDDADIKPEPGTTEASERAEQMDPEDIKRPSILIQEIHERDTVVAGKLRFSTREETCLGKGSNGTAVYPGTFDGQPVAVKRLLKSASSLAAKEIKTLLENQGHANVIRFIGKEESASFTYMALELFTTSLDRFVENTETFTDMIALPEGYDMKNCLEQITRGVQYLHSLKLVHRDIKPQNILVKKVPSRRVLAGPPQLQFVISDFGLAKPLDDSAVSMYEHTVHHTAAGTTGWRAPELLRAYGSTNFNPNATTADSIMPASSSDGEHTPNASSSSTIPAKRRATKAIDIFSLGCVFFYVLTQGKHPFDIGGESVGRDYHIRNGQYNTDELHMHEQHWGEAEELVQAMIADDFHIRPKAEEVLRHPFFWEDERKLDFLGAVSDSFEECKKKIEPQNMQKGKKGPKPELDANAPRTPEQVDAFFKVQKLEALGPEVFGGPGADWVRKLDRVFREALEKDGKRGYDGKSVLHLLRCVRNKKAHFLDLPIEAKRLIRREAAKGRCAIGGGAAVVARNVVIGVEQLSDTVAMQHQDELVVDDGMEWIDKGLYGFWARLFPMMLVSCRALVDREGWKVEMGLGKYF